MSTYMLIDTDTGELVRENITSQQLKRANALLRLTKLSGLLKGFLAPRPTSKRKKPRPKTLGEAVEQLPTLVKWLMAGVLILAICV